MSKQKTAPAGVKYVYGIEEDIFTEIKSLQKLLEALQNLRYMEDELLLYANDREEMITGCILAIAGRLNSFVPIWLTEEQAAAFAAGKAGAE